MSYTAAQANRELGWTRAKLRAYYDAEAQACRQFGDEGACLARVARHVPVTLGSTYCTTYPDGTIAMHSRGGMGMTLAQVRALKANLRADGLGDSGDGLGQTEGQIAGNVVNALALVIRDPEGTMRVQGPAIVAAADRHIVGPLVASGVRAAMPYVWRYAVPAFGLVYLLAGAAAYFSFKVLKKESLKANRRSRRK